MTNPLRTTFWVHALVAAIIGLAMVFAPTWTGDLMRWEAVDTTMTQLYGVAVLALGFCSALCALARRWEQVAIPVSMEIFFTVAGIALVIYQFAVGVVPVTMWIIVALWAAFLVAFGYFALQAHPSEAEGQTPAFR